MGDPEASGGQSMDHDVPSGDEDNHVNDDMQPKDKGSSADDNIDQYRSHNK